jgi:EAL domain-containing protein (putative c-di-GMP-specific phosphodiesterase class I)
MMVDPRRSAETLDRLGALGVGIAVDDFGTGYSSLAYLKRLPVSAVKIDQSFVRNLLTGEHDRVIVRSTIGMAHELGLRVVAEGVEDYATLQLLRSWGCDEAQGYYLGRAMPAGDVVATGAELQDQAA